MTITANYTKMLSLKIWRYFAEHPEISHKDELPEELLSQIKDMVLNCPLCEFFLQVNGPMFYCTDCPLDSCSMDNSLYMNWVHSINYEDRLFFSREIVRSIEAWDIKELSL